MSVTIETLKTLPAGSTLSVVGLRSLPITAISNYGGTLVLQIALSSDYHYEFVSEKLKNFDVALPPAAPTA